MRSFRQLQDASHWSAVFYMVALVLFGSFFIINLTLAVIKSVFSRVHDGTVKRGASFVDKKKAPKSKIFLSRREREMITSYVRRRKFKHKLFSLCLKWCSSKIFQNLFMALIIINTVILEIEHHGMYSNLEKWLCILIHSLNL